MKYRLEIYIDGVFGRVSILGGGGQC